jgi:hypothetical protein
MTERSLDEVTRFAAHGLRDVAQELEEALDRAPRLGELLGMVMGALRWNRDDVVADVNASNILVLKPRFGGKRPPTLHGDGASDESVLNEVDDSVIVVASDFVVGLRDRFVAAVGAPPTIAQLCDILAAALHLGEPDMLGDVTPTLVREIVPSVKKSGKIRAQIGDLVAIPAGPDSFYVAVVLQRNAFGTAYGFFSQTVRPGQLSFNAHPPVHPYPIHSTEDAITNGHWRIVGHDERFLSLFPAEPEIFHQKSNSMNVNNPQIGAFGAGETASGHLRTLTEEEARAIGLLSGEYRQTYMYELLEKQLPAILG